MIQIKEVTTEGAELEIIRALFTEYEKELDTDLRFQNFNEELKNPLKKYGSPQGMLMLGYFNDEIAGCVAFAPLAPPEVLRR